MRLLPLWVALALLVGWAAPARAETELDVAVGLAGRVVQDTFATLRVTVRHSGVPVDARLVVSQTVDSPWSGVLTERLVQPVGLGQRSQKRFALLFHLRSLIYPLHVRLETAAGATLAGQTLELRDRGSQEPLTLALSEGGFPASLPDGVSVRTVAPETLPAHPAGFDPVQRLYLGRFDPNRLEPDQRDALLHWVMRGGELVLFAGENWFVQDAPFLRPWLPLVPEGRPAAADPLVLRGAVRGTVTYARGEQPWVVRRRVGAGWIWMSALNPLTAEVPDAFWGGFRSPSALESEVPFSQWAREAFDQTILPFPNRSLIAAALGLLVAGSALGGWLTLRTRWGVLALLGWTGASALSFGLWLGQPPYAQPLAATEYGVERALPDGNAHAHTWFGVFAERREQVTLALPAGAAVRQDLPPQRGDHLFDLESLLEGAHALRFTAHPGRVRGFTSSALRPAALRGEWGADRSTVEVVSQVDLTRAWLWRSGTVYDLGPLAAGEPKRVALDAARRAPLAEFVPRAVAALWAWALRTTQSPYVLGGWHDRASAQSAPADEVRTRAVQLVLTEGP